MRSCGPIINRGPSIGDARDAFIHIVYGNTYGY